MRGKSLPFEEIQNLLENGKTGLIKGFKSKRTGRLFDAFLTVRSGKKWKSTVKSMKAWFAEED